MNLYDVSRAYKKALKKLEINMGTVTVSINFYRLLKRVVAHTWHWTY